MNGMIIDSFFTEKNAYLISYAKKKCLKYRRNYSAEDVISEIYIRLHKKTFKDKQEIEKFILKCISNEIKNSNSQMNYIKKIDITEELTDVELEQIEVSPVMQYYNTTKNIEHKILLEAFIELGHDTQMKLANYFNLSTTTINKLFKEIKINIIHNTKNK